MRTVRAEDLGFVGPDAEMFEALPIPDAQFPPGKQLGLWEQWVRELERGQLWVPEDIDAACAARDDLDDLMAELPESLAARVFDFVETLDRTFRDWTVDSTYLAGRRTDARWWWGRVPLRPGQRLFLFNLWAPDRYRNR